MIQIDIDMPKTCDDCPFHRYHSGRNFVCVATPLFYPMNLANYKGGRKDFCPLKEVPQEPVLDKIRAEIWDLQYGDEEKSMTDEDRADAYNNAIKHVIEIIDKYKTESEP